MLACLVDASTGMVLASRKDQDDISLSTAAPGAADIANVLFPIDGRASGGRPRGRDGDLPPPALRDTPGQSGAADLAAGDSRPRPGEPGYGAPGNPHLLCDLRRMSQTSRFTRARQLTSTVLPGRRLDGYADQVTGRLRRIAAARSTGMLPFSVATVPAISGTARSPLRNRPGLQARPRMTRRRRTSRRWTGQPGAGRHNLKRIENDLSVRRHWPEDLPSPAPAVTLTVPLTSGRRKRPGCIRAR